MVTGGSGAGTRFFGQTAQTARLMMYCLLAVVLMAMDHRGHFIPTIRGSAEYLVEPVYHLIEWPARALRNVFAQFTTRRTLRHENEGLREQLMSQQASLQRLQTLEEENHRLRSLFEGAERQPYAYQFAELLRVDLDPFSHKVLVNRGSQHGVRVGQAIIDGAGVMGQVEEVHLHFSTIRLISDPNHALPVQVNRTGLRTVAFGTGETGVLLMPSVPREADVREGDLVVTSGLGDRFPGGYPVAEISRIDREQGRTFALVEARPLAALDRGREVLLIEPPPAKNLRLQPFPLDELPEPDEVSPDEASDTRAPDTEAQDTEAPDTEAVDNE